MSNVVGMGGVLGCSGSNDLSKYHEDFDFWGSRAWGFFELAVHSGAIIAVI